MTTVPHPEAQTAAGKVLWHLTMSLDGFVAGPNHEMDWMSGFSGRPGLEEEYAATTGAVLGGRDSWDASPCRSRWTPRAARTSRCTRPRSGPS